GCVRISSGGRLKRALSNECPIARTNEAIAVSATGAERWVVRGLRIRDCNRIVAQISGRDGDIDWPSDTGIAKNLQRIRAGLVRSHPESNPSWPRDSHRHHVLHRVAGEPCRPYQ